MNMQAQHSGQISGQMPNQAGTMLPGLTPQNLNPMPPIIQRNVLNMDHPDIARARRYMQEKILGFIIQRRQPPHEAPTKKLIDFVKRLEEGLAKNATTMEEYMNLETLESRLQFVIKRPVNNNNQQFSQPNTSHSVGTMIPTPGLPQTGGSSLIGSSMVDNTFVASSKTITSPTVNPGSFFPSANGSTVSGNHSSYSSSDGALLTRYQQAPSTFCINAGVNNMKTSLGARRTSQMIPTPGFNNSISNNINSSVTNQLPVPMESSNNVEAFQAVESTVVSQPIQQMQHIGDHNSRIQHNIGQHMGGEIRSTLYQKSYGLSNATASGSLGSMGNKMLDDQVATENYLAGTSFGNSIKPLHQHFDQTIRSSMQGDGYEIDATDAAVSGNFYVPVSSTVSMMNNQNLSAVSHQMQSMPKVNPPLMTSQSILNAAQPVTAMKSQSIDQSQKMNIRTQFSGRENLVHSHQYQQFQQQSHQIQLQQLVQRQVEQDQQTQDQHFLKSDAFVHSHPPSDIVSEGKYGRETDYRGADLQVQVSDPSQLTDMQNQFQRNSVKAPSAETQLLSHLSGHQDVCSSLNQTSDQIQFLHPRELTTNSQREFVGFPGDIQPDGSQQGQWNSNPRDVSQVSGRHPISRNVPDEFHHRLTGQNAAQLNNLSSEETVMRQSDVSKLETPQNLSKSLNRSNTLDQEQQFKNQLRWLLFLRHARSCSAPEGKCQDTNCITAQRLLKHRENCNVLKCSFPRCHATKVLINHNRICRDAVCPVCTRFRNFVLAQQKAYVHSEVNSGLIDAVHGSCISSETAEISGSTTSKTSLVVAETLEDLQPSIKRMKIEKPSQFIVSETESSEVQFSTINEPPVQNDQSFLQKVKTEIAESKKEISVDGQLSSMFPEKKKDNMVDACIQRHEGYPLASQDSTGFGVDKVMEVKKEENTSVPSENVVKSAKPKIKGVSLIELFTPEQVRRHIAGLRQWVGQSKAKAEKNQALKHSMSENSCQLCAVEKLTFEPPPIYCTPCGTRIKRNAMYYTIGAGETRNYFCIPCYNETRGDTIVVDGTANLKARMEKKKNDDDAEEWWVQCDKCEAWQHQICALFNGKRNDGGQAEYTCPNCCVVEVEQGERVPLPQSAVLGAKDLPRSILSDHIEQRLFLKLKQERQDRARLQGKCYDEVPGADALVVRVVSSVDKKLEVKPRFLSIFQEDNYPLEFPYKSKVILLFQKIEGVEVCLFGMYVQEFGSECRQPNHRRVYLSYLDSVKYFRPEVRAVTGEALRTFVYHEILIGYLDYCKKRGFTSCYIWACPPMKGEDYILYCHPEIQKTPKSDKLREWYLAMLRKAKEEKIVAELTNLYDHFFTSTGECKSKVTAARLPYFEGDYWPGAAEDMIYQLQQEEDGRKPYKKGMMKKIITKRALKASGQTDLSGNATKDLLLMHKLGETIFPMKEDFIMVHLQHACTHCCVLLVSGNRWDCRQCKNFHLCEKCYDAERKREDRDRHPMNQKDKHALYSVEITGVPDDTKDKDEIVESEFFDTRQAFLSLCQGNHYQYDTLRRAKHSSMMVLYHLHNPTAPAFVSTCSMCHHDIESGQGWRCEICTDYDVCNACYQKDGGINHPHKLTNNPSNDRDAQSKEARELRVTQLRKMLELLVHASQCRSPHCQYPNCRKVKGLFRHGMLCKTRASGGCVLCKRMWHLLQLHARACKISECNVPRCRDLKEHMRRLQQQSDSRRRAAVMEMMRQRAAEVAGSS